MATLQCESQLNEPLTRNIDEVLESNKYTISEMLQKRSTHKNCSFQKVFSVFTLSASCVCAYHSGKIHQKRMKKKNE